MSNPPFFTCTILSCIKRAGAESDPVTKSECDATSKCRNICVDTLLHSVLSNFLSIKNVLASFVCWILIYSHLSLCLMFTVQFCCRALMEKSGKWKNLHSKLTLVFYLICLCVSSGIILIFLAFFKQWPKKAYRSLYRQIMHFLWIYKSFFFGECFSPLSWYFSYKIQNQVLLYKKHIYVLFSFSSVCCCKCTLYTFL